MDAGELLAVDVVAEAAVLGEPAVLDGVDQGVGIGEGLVDVTEPAALLALIVGVDEGIDVVDCLVLCLLCEGVQAAGAHVDLVADLAGVLDGQGVLCIPCCVSLGGQLDAADDAQSVGSLGIDGRGLILPVQGQSQGVGLLVELHVLQIEVLVDDLQAGVIHVHVGIEADDGLDLGQDTDTLSQLQQEAPCGSVLSISAGQHVDQVAQLCGDGDLGHIQCEGVGSDHILVGVHDLIGHLVLGGGVGNQTVPCHLTVAAGGLVEVEGHFALIVQGDGHHSVLGSVVCQSGGDLNALHAGVLCGGEGEALNHAGSVIAQGEDQVGSLDGDLLALVQSLDGQVHGLAVNGVDIGLGEVDIVGIDDVDGLGTDDLFAMHQVDLNGTNTGGGECAVSGDGAHSVIGQSPDSALGQLGGVAGGADALGGNMDSAADGHVVVVGLDHSMVKCGGAGCGGDHHQRGGNGTGCAVGGTVDNCQLLSAGLLCDVGGGTAAVQVNSCNTASLQHDLCDLLHAAAAGEGLLTAVQDHQNDLAGLGDTDSGAASTVGVVILGSVDGDLTILDQGGTEAGDAFLDLTLVDGVVLLGGTDDGSAVLQDTEEAVGIDCVVLNTTHDQQTAGLAGGHVIACAVGGGHNAVVGDVVLALGVAVLLLSCIGLIQDTLHCPAGSGIVVVVVCEHLDIITGDVGGGDVVDHLLLVGRGCVLDLLGDAGSQHCALRREHGVVGILSHVDIVASQLADVVSECVAASLTQLVELISGDVLEIAGALQSGDQLVAGEGVVDSLTQGGTGGGAIHAVTQIVVSSINIGQILGEVAGQDRGQSAGFILDSLQGIHDPQAVQVAAHILFAEGAGGDAFDTECLLQFGDSLQQVVLADVVGVQSLIDSVHAVSQLHQVNDIACPASNVGMVLAEVVVVGDVHGAEHVDQIDQVAVGQDDAVNVLHAGDLQHLILGLSGGVDGVLGLADIGCEVLVLVTGHHSPGAGGVAVSAGTDVLDDQIQGVLAGVLQHVSVCHFLQQGQVLDEGSVVRDDGDIQLGDLHVAFLLVADGALLMCFPTDGVVGGILGSNRLHLVALGSVDFPGHVVTVLAVAALAVTVGGTGSGEFLFLDQDVGQLLDGLLGDNDLAADAAVAALGLAGSGTAGLNSSVDYFLVAGSGNDFLLNEDSAAGGAVAALGDTGSGTGGCNSSVDDLGVAQSGDDAQALGVVTAAAVAAAGNAGQSAGGLDCCIIDQIVIQSSDQFLAADGTDLSFGTGSLSAGGMAQGCDQFSAAGDTGLSGGAGSFCASGVAQSCDGLLCNENDVTAAAVAALGQAGGSTGGRNSCIDDLGMTQSLTLGVAAGGAGCGSGTGSISHVMAGGGDDFSVRVAAVDGILTGQGLQTISSTGSCLVDGFVVGMVTSLVPDAIGIGVGTGGVQGGHVGAISVLQHGGGQGDLHIAGVLDQLMGDGLGAGLSHSNTIAGAVDICTAGGGVDKALGCVDGTVDNDLSIHQVGLGTGVLTARGVGEGDQLLVAGSCIAAPLVCVVDVDVDIAAQNAGGAFIDDDLCAGQQSQILVHGDGTFVDMNGQVGVQGQVIVLGVDGRSTDAHVDGREGHIAVSFHDQAVGLGVVLLDHVTISQVEHGAGVGNECNSRAKVSAGHVDGGVSVLSSAGMDGQGDLNILDIVLRQGEDAVFHVGTLGAATEVHDLEVLIDLCAALGLDGAGAGDEAVDIQSAAIVDGDLAVAFHLHKADVASGRTTIQPAAVCIAMLGRQAHGTVDGQVRTVSQGQGTIGRGSSISLIADTDCLGGVHGVGGVEGDQQGDAGRNGVVTCRQGGIVHQNQSVGIVGCRIVRCRIQIVKEVAGTDQVVLEGRQTQQAGARGLLSYTAHSKPGSAAVLGEDGTDGHVLCGNQGIGRSSGQDLAVNIGPAKEVDAGVDSCCQLNAGRTADAQDVAACNSAAACGHGTHGVVILESDFRAFLDGDQADVGHGQGNREVGKTAVGGDHNHQACACIQHRGVAAAGSCGSAGNGEAACLISGVVKGQRSIRAGVVGNGDIVGLLGKNAALCSGSISTTGELAGVARVGNGELAIIRADVGHGGSCIHLLHDFNELSKNLSVEGCEFLGSQFLGALLQSVDALESLADSFAILCNDRISDLCIAHTGSDAVLSQNAVHFGLLMQACGVCAAVVVAVIFRSKRLEGRHGKYQNQCQQHGQTTLGQTVHVLSSLKNFVFIYHDETS